MKELKRIKTELTNKIKTEDNARKLLEKRKDREILMLNTNLDKSKKKENKTQINLKEHQIALKDRRT